MMTLELSQSNDNFYGLFTALNKVGTHFLQIRTTLLWHWQSVKVVKEHTLGNEKPKTPAKVINISH